MVGKPRLARRLDVSIETIRRDLDELTEQGVLNRTYGRAVRSLSTERSITERRTLSVAERERIAKAAGPFLKDARVIGSGSTIVHVARRIAVDMKNITVIMPEPTFGSGSTRAPPTTAWLEIGGKKRPPVDFSKVLERKYYRSDDVNLSQNSPASGDVQSTKR